MKLSIAGKGGVGKTTLSSLLARLFAAEGRRVLAIDADPDANLARAVGLSRSKAADVKPIGAMRQLAKERTGHGGGFGGFFKLNPTVDDLPDALSVEHAGVRLLALGQIEHGGHGCACPEHTLLRALIGHLLVDRDDVVIMDMEAGVEHLGRGTADAVDLLIVVVEPGQRSLDTGQQIERLARDIGIDAIAYVGSKVSSPEDRSFIAEALPKGSLLGTLSLSPELLRADREGIAPYECAPSAVAEARQIKSALESRLHCRGPNREANQCA